VKRLVQIPDPVTQKLERLELLLSRRAFEYGLVGRNCREEALYLGTATVGLDRGEISIDVDEMLVAPFVLNLPR
jgi:hypothetical protein